MKVAKCAASHPPRINIYHCFLSDIFQIPVDLNLPINDYRTARELTHAADVPSRTADPSKVRSGRGAPI
jgi:hypothetical protein